MRWLSHCRRPLHDDALARSWRPPAGFHPARSRSNRTRTVSPPESPQATDVRISAHKPIPRGHMKAAVSIQSLDLPLDFLRYDCAHETPAFVRMQPRYGAATKEVLTIVP